jgi:hypothetical protein
MRPILADVNPPVTPSSMGKIGPLWSDRPVGPRAGARVRQNFATSCQPGAAAGRSQGQEVCVEVTGFAEYFAARRETVRRTAYLLCGNWYWADDLAQEAFVRLAGAWGRVREPAALDAYVRTCLVRRYLSERRRLWRHRERSTGLPEFGYDDHADRVDLRRTFVEALATHGHDRVRVHVRRERRPARTEGTRTR